MIEHATWGVILDRTRDDELDTEYSIFTWDLGKVRAKAQSVRKITSKLAGHLEPGSLSRLRLVQKSADGNFKAVESLVEERSSDPAVIRALLFADKMTPLLQHDLHLFAFLKDLVSGVAEGTEAAYYRRLLAILGYDPDNASCSVCGKAKIAYFVPQDIIFLCHQCLQDQKRASDQGGISLRQ
jgi:DNA repair protein RecO (recombination protein O)